MTFDTCTAPFLSALAVRRCYMNRLIVYVLNVAKNSCLVVMTENNSVARILANCKVLVTLQLWSACKHLCWSIPKGLAIKDICRKYLFSCRSPLSACDLPPPQIRMSALDTALWLRTRLVY